MLEISADALTKDFGAIRAVDDVSFRIEPGRVVGVLGPNGSGKTTTLRILLGLVTPTRGEARIGGRRFADLERPAREVGAVLEARSFHPGRTARDHLRVAAVEARIARGRVEEMLELVELTDAADRKAGRFSLGMGQRLSLATALLGDPAVLILDEPANGLDPAGIRWLRRFLRGLADEGRTVLLSSHALAEVAQTVDDVLILDRGRLKAHRQMADVDSLEDDFIEVGIHAPRTAAPRAALRQRPGAPRARRSGPRVGHRALLGRGGPWTGGVRASLHRWPASDPAAPADRSAGSRARRPDPARLRAAPARRRGARRPVSRPRAARDRRELLSVGPCSRLRTTRFSLKQYREPAYRAELNRRSRILTGRSFTLPPARLSNAPYCPLVRNQEQG